MTEQEIIKCLKENRNKGVIFAFMPDDVQNWCRKHSSEHIFSLFIHDKWINESRILCVNEIVYALSEDYEPKKSFKPDWQEFDIDDSGCFEFEGKKYYYREDARFETENRDRFRGFGGWLYSGNWHLDLSVVNGKGRRFRTYTVYMADTDGDIKPIIPTKICFWRIKE